MNKPTLYDTFRQLPDGRTQRKEAVIICWGIVISGGEVVRYEFLNLSTKQFADVLPEQFDRMIKNGIWTEIKL